MVAVEMAGGAFVPLDPKAPSARTRGMLEDIKAKLVLCAPAYKQQLQECGVDAISVDEDMMLELPDSPQGAVTSAVTPSDPSFLIFTSGSTGKPKSIVLQHNSICSSSNAYGKASRIGPSTRVFQFSSYTFDIGILDVLVTLMRGGCVCVPSDHQRVNDLAGAMASMKANWAFLTPTVADLLSPADVPELKVLCMGGEALGQESVARWTDAVELHGMYGPAEVSGLCAWNSSLGKAGKSTNIGRPLSSAFWVVNPTWPTRLVPDGCVGELLIQGPLLARGYLTADEKALSNWISEPQRLPSDVPSARAYLTGDLVRRNEDGSFDYVGRKDSQVKINGQRTELREIESQLLELLPKDMRGIIEVLPGKDRSLDSLISFLWYIDGPNFTQSTVQILDTMNDDKRTVISQLDSALRSILPSYMIPSTYLILQGCPEQTLSGKIDRRRLLSLGRATSLSERRLFAPQTVEREPPTTAMELKLRDLWAGVLGIAPDDIGKHDSFLRVGGDSISAILLVSKARQHSVGLTVAKVFDNPRLADMAIAATTGMIESDTESKPFTLLHEGVDEESVTREIRRQCRLPASEAIEDVYPCTKLQEGLMALAAKQPGSYVAKNVYRLHGSTDPVRFKAAWEKTIELCDILRTRIALLEEGTAVQALIAADKRWEVVDNEDLGALIEASKRIEMGYGSRLCRYAIIENNGTRYFVWIIHHAIFDGWTVRIVLNTLAQVYRQSTPSPLQKYSTFIKYASGIDSIGATEYWSSQLQGAKRAIFPPSTNKTEARVNSSITKTSIPFPPSTHTSITKASVLRAAWAIVLARYCDTDDVCFGMTVSGRHAPIPRVDEVAGPMVATVPVRTRLDPQCLVSRFLQDVQSQASSMIPFEQFGLQNISKAGPDADAACDFSSLLVLQPPEIISVGDEASGSILVSGRAEQALAEEAMGNYFSYPLVLQAVILEDRIELMFVYDPSILVESQCLAVAHQLHHVSQQLLTPDKKLLASISVGGPWDLKKALEWNGPQHPVLNACVHDLIRETALQHPEHEAVFSMEGSLTYEELEHLSSRLADHLSHLGVRKEVTVPLCFEKSMWAIVAMLGVLKAGGVFVPLDPLHPEDRRRTLVQDVGAQIIVASPSTALACKKLVPNVVELSAQSLPQIGVLTNGNTPLMDKAEPSNAAYVLFTSGSTGRPKTIVVSHSALSSSLIGYERAYTMNKHSRVLQFSNYAFDVSLSEILETLVFGGTVCVPTEEDRLGNIVDFVRKSRSNTAMLTSSFLKTLRPIDLPTLKLLLLVGEPPTTDILETWMPHADVVNAYGPSECSIFCMSHLYRSPAEPPTTVGRGFSGSCWIIEPGNHDRLAPVGCVGEILLYRHMARGYLHDPKTTAKSFISSVDWLPTPTRDDPRRFYKTGDLARYNPDGTIEYLGRRDTQVKLRGYRIELGEVEYSIQKSLPNLDHVAAEVVRDGSRESLIAFLSFRDTPTQENGRDDLLIPMSPSLQALLASLVADLKAALPSYMIPSFFLPIRIMPFGSSMKLDRKALRALAGSISTEELSTFSLAKQDKVAPTTEMELKICQMWAQILQISPDEIGKHDSFLEIGGDSLSAIRLVSLAEQQGVIFSVKTIFQNPELENLATFAAYEEGSSTVGPEPFSMLDLDNLSLIKDEIKNQCGLQSTQEIEDAYPCTSLQEGLMALTAKQPGAYVAKYVYQLPGAVDSNAFKAAWEATLAHCGNLRTRIVHVRGSALQALIHTDAVWEQTGDSNLERFMKITQKMSMGYGSPLCRYALLKDFDGRRYFVWVIHHALFDGWSNSFDSQHATRGIQKVGSYPTQAVFVLCTIHDRPRQR